MPGTFGERLREIRGSSTREAFSEVVGISARALSNYETGLRMPKGDVVARISAQTGVSLPWLLTGLGEKSAAAAAVLESQPSEIIDGGQKKLLPRQHFLGKSPADQPGYSEKPACDEGEKAATVAAFPDSAGTQQPEIIEGGTKKAATVAGNEGGDAPPQPGYAASRPAAATGEAAPAPAAPAGAPDLAAQLVAALRENAALLRELGDLRVQAVEQRVELERLRAELSSARARCALLEERERERERTDSGG